MPFTRIDSVNPDDLDPDELEYINSKFPTRRAQIEGVIAQAFLNPKGMVLMDPEDPKVDVNALYQARGGQMLDPKVMNFNCPLCKRTMAYELFVQHVEPCMKKWYKLTDPTLRNFAGPQDARIIGATAEASSEGEVPDASKGD